MKNNNYNNNNITESDKWITVLNKKSQLRKKEIDIRNKFKQNDDYNDTYKIQHETMKKMLCNNILVHGECNYGDKCMYAHSVEQQNVDPIRKKAYNIIMDREKISTKPDKELGRTLLQLTKVCEECVKNKCPGGYNCKYGAFDKKYQICSDDLRYGICYNPSCNNIHLTNKGLIPLNANNNNKIETIRIIKSNKSKNINIPEAVLLSDDFFMKLTKSKQTNDENVVQTIDNNSDCDSNSSENLSNDRIKAYLEYNSDSDKSCNESIFE